jgi:hypothetical protein
VTVLETLDGAATSVAEAARRVVAGQHFAAAAAALDRAAELCELAPSPDCEAEALVSLRARIDRLAALAAGTPPAREDLEAAIAAAADAPGSWHELDWALREAVPGDREASATPQ